MEDDNASQNDSEDGSHDGSQVSNVHGMTDLIAIEASSISKMNVQDELWRIFTFYTLHSDSANLEAMKTSLFVKMCKDVQISSKRFTGTQIELELAKILRQLRGTEVKVGGTFISFVEFLAVLEGIAPSVYPNCPVDVACRRLLLENVLLLAGRRNESANFDLDNEEAANFLQGPMIRALGEIFKHYVSIAEIHRTAHSSAAVPGVDGGTLKKLSLKELRTQITFREFHQFCLDYSLKSATLLTGMHIGHIFLTAVPLEEDTKMCKGMTVEMFHKAIVHISLIAYRQHSSNVITPLLKTKALLLHMWKTVNKSENSIKAVKSTTKVFSSASPNFNLYGSSVFSDHFLKIWMGDKFVDYFDSADVSSEDVGGGDIVNRIAFDSQVIDEDNRANVGLDIFTPDEEGEEDHATDAARLISAIEMENNPAAGDDGGGADGVAHAAGGGFAAGSTVTIKGTDLHTLLQAKPEIAELLLLELNALALGK